MAHTSNFGGTAPVKMPFQLFFFILNIPKLLHFWISFCKCLEGPLNQDQPTESREPQANPETQFAAGPSANPILALY